MGSSVDKSATFGIWVVAASTAILSGLPAIGYYAPDKFVLGALTAPTAFTIASVGLSLMGSGSTTA